MPPTEKVNPTLPSNGTPLRRSHSAAFTGVQRRLGGAKGASVPPRHRLEESQVIDVLAQVRACPDHRVRPVGRVVHRARRERGELVLQLGQVPDDVPFPLLPEGADWFTARELSSRGMDERDRKVWPDRSQSRLAHGAALVRLADDPVGAERVEEVDRRARPGVGRAPEARVAENVEVPVAPAPHRHDAGEVGPLARAHRRIDAHHDPHEVGGRRRHAGPVEEGPVPQRAGHVVEQFGADFVRCGTRSAATTWLLIRSRRAL
jgi:hypothetical protein